METIILVLDLELIVLFKTRRLNKKGKDEVPSDNSYTTKRENLNRKDKIQGTRPIYIIFV
jgi:hypothetical protein